MNNATTDYILSQTNPNRDQDVGGYQVKLLAFNKKARKLFFVLLAVPIVLVVRLFRPWVLVRFGCIESDRIGSFLQNVELYFCEQELNPSKKRTFDVFYYTEPISNRFLQKMWERKKLAIFPLVKWLEKVNQLIPGGEVHTIPRLNSDRDAHGWLALTKPHLEFIEEEKRLGAKELTRLGISTGAPFVCFHCRDSAYLEKTYTGRSWDYHNFRDASVENYLPAIEELVRRGYFAVRMGAIAKEKLNTNNPKILDYAANGSRTEFLDIYLGAKCDFFIANTAGIYAVGDVFRKPMVYVNYVPLGFIHTWNPKAISIPKKLWLKAQRRFMTFPEIVNSDIGLFFRSDLYEARGIEVIENTSEEIFDVVTEMDERLKGTWIPNNGDEELQKEFWRLFKPNKYYRVFASRIGTKFLRQNRDLLQTRP